MLPASCSVCTELVSCSPCHFLVLFLSKRVGLIWSRILSLISPVVAHVCQYILLVTTVEPMGHVMQWQYFKEELYKNSHSEENIQYQQSLHFTEDIFHKTTIFCVPGLLSLWFFYFIFVHFVFQNSITLLRTELQILFFSMYFVSSVTISNIAIERLTMMAFCLGTYPSLIFLAVINTMTKRNLGNKRLISSYTSR